MNFNPNIRKGVSETPDSILFSLTPGYVHSKIAELDEQIAKLRKKRKGQDELIKILREISKQ